MSLLSRDTHTPTIEGCSRIVILTSVATATHTPGFQKGHSHTLWEVLYPPNPSRLWRSGLGCAWLVRHSGEWRASASRRPLGRRGAGASAGHRNLCIQKSNTVGKMGEEETKRWTAVNQRLCIPVRRESGLVVAIGAVQPRSAFCGLGEGTRQGIKMGLRLFIHFAV